jgi:uncharacterized protein
LRTGVILYLDTSNLFKLFVEEQGSEHVEQVAAGAESIALSLVAYAEFRGSLARAKRAGRLTESLYDTALASFEPAWRSYSRVPVTEALINVAGGLAETYFLRGLDAIHLTSAITLQRELGEDVTFSAADGRLMAAAASEGLLVAT